jgi:hypothetical protein
VHFRFEDDDADARSAATSAREQKFVDLAGEADKVWPIITSQPVPLTMIASL